MVTTDNQNQGTVIPLAVSFLGETYIHEAINTGLPEWKRDMLEIWFYGILKILNFLSLLWNYETHFALLRI